MQMIKKPYFIIAAAAILLLFVIIGFSSKPLKNEHRNMLLVESVFFQQNGGWGYNILVGHKIFIHQNFIPAIQGNKVFINKEDAEKTSQLVVQKILHRKIPAVSKGEIDSLQIQY
jgi:hypothetical protein